MKILVIHNHYLEKGGEDKVVAAEVKLLTEHGHKVILYEKSNDNIRKLTFFKKLLFFLSEFNFSGTVYKELKEIIRTEKPDIAHIHNIFMCVTPSAYIALKEESVPIVQSLHNYRFFCLNGVFFRKGAICEKCKGRRFFNGVIKRCGKDSFLFSLFLARLLYKARRFLREIDSYIVTSEFSRNKFIEFGLPEEKIFLKVNFLTVEPEGSVEDHKYALFLGRLVDYKGVETLIKAFKMSPSFNLKIIGDGPLKKEVQDFASSCDNIERLGRVDQESVFKAIRNSSFVIFPSECYENMPLVVIESFAFSKPVLASRLGAAGEFVIEGVNGVLFEPGNAGDLNAKISCLFSHDKERFELGINANRLYREQFDKEKNYNELMNIYSKTIDFKKQCLI